MADDSRCVVANSPESLKANREDHRNATHTIPTLKGWQNLSKLPNPIPRGFETPKTDKVRRQRNRERSTLAPKCLSGRQAPVVIFKPGNSFGFSFDPNAVDSFPSVGSVYTGARVTDDWGVLEATSDVLFSRANGLITEVRVPVPAGVTDPPTKGDGWTLQINVGWKLAPGDRKGDWAMAKSP